MWCLRGPLLRPFAARRSIMAWKNWSSACASCPSLCAVLAARVLTYLHAKESRVLCEHVHIVHKQQVLRAQNLLPWGYHNGVAKDDNFLLFAHKFIHTIVRAPQVRKRQRTRTHTRGHQRADSAVVPPCPPRRVLCQPPWRVSGWHSMRTK